MLKIFLMLMLFWGVAGASEPTPNSGAHMAKPDSAINQNQNTLLKINQFGIPVSGTKAETVIPDSSPVLDDNGGKTHNYFSSEWILVFVTVALVIVTGSLALYTKKLWKATVKLSDDAQATSKRQADEIKMIERAYLYLDKFNVELTTAENNKTVDMGLLPENYQEDPGLFVARLAVQPRWKNGGNTPTNDMTFNVNWALIIEGQEVDYSYRGAPSKLFIAPKAVEPTRFIEMPGVQKVIDHGAFRTVEGSAPIVIIWGQADYLDVFASKHFIEWCYEVRFERHKVDGPLSVSFNQWGEHNRSD